MLSCYTIGQVEPWATSSHTQFREEITEIIDSRQGERPMKRRPVHQYLSALFVVAIGLQTAGRCADSDADISQDFNATVNENFARWDRNHDGVLSAGEIKKAFSNPNTSGRAAAAITVLQRLESSHFSHHEPLQDFTLDQLNEMGSKGSAAYKKTKKSFANSLKKINEASPQLFAHGLPQIDEIRQGGANDCWFISVIGAMAHQRPRELANLIESNDDGSFTVYFHNHKPVKVNCPSAGELSAWNSNGGNGLWLHVLLKAYGKVELAKNIAKNKVDPIEGVVTHGGGTGPVVKLLTGHESDSKKVKEWGNSLRPRLTEAFAKNRLVFVGVPGHVMAGYGYDPQSDQLQIWNPWGSTGNYKELGANMKNGLFSVPMSEVFDKCTRITFENPNRRKNKRA